MTNGASGGGAQVPGAVVGTCKETSGILFERKCKQPAEAKCKNCKKAICVAHMRTITDQGQPYQLCIGCTRAHLKNRQRRGSYAHLRDDPYMYWYNEDYYWDDDPYDADDFDLFDRADESVSTAYTETTDAADDSTWEGS